MSNYSFDYSQYKNKIYKKNPYSFTLIFLLIIILLGLCVFLKPINNKHYKYYFVEVDCFQTYKDALMLSNSLQERGGAGYVYFDNSYHVLASFYVEYDDAKMVANNIKNEYSNAKVFTIETKKFINNTNLNSAQNKAVKNLLETTKEQIVKLEKFSNKYDIKKLSYTELSIHLKNLQKDYDERQNNFITAFKSYSKYNLAKEYLEEINTSLKAISNESEQNISKALRYHTINIVINRYQFLSCF